ncbi:MAG: cation acetate symporter [Fischerella sp.]|nr:cation acetate symporter [Fischerella sp.]
MKRMICICLIVAFAVMMTDGIFGSMFYGESSLVISEAFAQSSQATQAQGKLQANRAITIPMFVLIIIVTLGIVYWAAKRTKTTHDFYAARSSITGTQNGWAIAGDFMSAATFLGVPGLMSVFGFDGLYWCIGPMLAFITIFFLTAEPLRNLGRYTLGDVLTLRGSEIPIRSAVALSTFILCIMYLITQLVGAGQLMRLLLGIPYEVSVIGTGFLMIMYVLFGGMIATTWVQIIKAVILFSGGVILFLLVVLKLGFSITDLVGGVTGSAAVKEWVQTGLLKHALPQEGFDYGQRFIEPGLFMSNHWDQLSNCIGFLLGTAATPHILMRFFTVPNAKEARKSAVIATLIIGSFFLMVSTFIGWGAAQLVTPQVILKAGGGGNMASLLLGKLLGTEIAPWVGDVILAYLCAVAFATILAVVSGVVLAGAGGLAHDFYVNIIKRGKCDQSEQMKAARFFAVVVGSIGIILTLLCENQNVAHLGILAFGIAASGNFPAMILSMFWKRMSTAGVIAALLAGTIASVGFVLVSPTMQYPKMIAAQAKKMIDTLEAKEMAGQVLSEKELATLTKAKETYEKNKDKKSIVGLDKPLFPLKNPGLVAAPIGFIAGILFSLMIPNRKEEEAFAEQYVRLHLGRRIEELG